jgi:hypothetical protein
VQDYECVVTGKVNGGTSDFVLEVRIPVTSLCPCSKAICDYGAHNQRGYITVEIRSRPDPHPHPHPDLKPELVWIEELVEMAEASGSAPLYPLLKREVERHVTMAGDAAFYSASNEKTAHEKSVKRVCVPNRSTKSAERKREQKKRWFRAGQKWRTGCEGRISVMKRRHGLNRCRYKGDDGMDRWVGFGVIADNLINIGRVLTRRANSPPVN